MRLWPILLLIISNLFMTFAWYGHLRDHRSTSLWLVILVSWGIALFEYCFQVPANRLGMQAGYNLAQMKTLQELITIGVFIAFSVLFFHESLKWNQAVGFGLVVLGAAFVFKPW